MVELSELYPKSSVADSGKGDARRGRSIASTPSGSGKVRKGRRRASTPVVEPKYTGKWTRGGLPKFDSDEACEATAPISWMMHMLTRISGTIGYGNLWLFPMAAYTNNGAAYLVAYLTWAFFFGIPAVYMESVIGQFTQRKSIVAFGMYVPIGKGIGWMCALIPTAIALLYSATIAWSFIYFVFAITWGEYKWRTCTNRWNTETCHNFRLCQEEKKPVQYNYTCDEAAFNISDEITYDDAVSAGEQFFKYMIVNKRTDFSSDQKDNVALTIFLMTIPIALVWILICIGLIFMKKGRKNWFARANIIIVIAGLTVTIFLAVRVFFLRGSGAGFAFLFTDVTREKLFQPRLWIMALSQLCMSLGIGLGANIQYGTGRGRSHRVYKDTFIFVAADTAFSLVAAFVIFGFLGHASHSMQKPVDKIFSTGIELPFVTIAALSSEFPYVAPAIAAVVFLNYVAIGLTSCIGLIDTLISGICDAYPKMAKRRMFVVIAICVVEFAGSVKLFAFEDAVSSVSQLITSTSGMAVLLCAMGEIFIISQLYGILRFYRDIMAMSGYPRKLIQTALGSSGWLIKILTGFSAPAIAIIVPMIAFERAMTGEKTNVDGKKDESKYYFYLLTAMQFLPLPLYAISTLCNVAADDEMSVVDAFRPSPSHPASKYLMAPPSRLKEFWMPPYAGEECHSDPETMEASCPMSDVSPSRSRISVLSDSSKVKKQRRPDVSPPSTASILY